MTKEMTKLTMIYTKATTTNTICFIFLGGTVNCKPSPINRVRLK